MCLRGCSGPAYSLQRHECSIVTLSPGEQCFFLRVPGFRPRNWHQAHGADRKTSLVLARRGWGQVCLPTPPRATVPSRERGGQSVCPSTQPSSGHSQFPAPLGTPWSLSPATPFQGT